MQKIYYISKRSITFLGRISMSRALGINKGHEIGAGDGNSKTSHGGYIVQSHQTVYL
jgi:hypothetical protein